MCIRHRWFAIADALDDELAAMLGAAAALQPQHLPLSRTLLQPQPRLKKKRKKKRTPDSADLEIYSVENEVKKYGICIRCYVIARC